jgi:glycosyltransferase involved in cell wall biosynthesis
MMLDDRERRHEMGRRAREKAERLYDREGHYERIEEIYRQVLTGTR